MLSGSSNEERDSIARRTGGINVSSRNNSNLQHGSMGPRNKKDDQRPITPTKRPDHRKFIVASKRPFLNLEDFMFYMDEAFEGERPELIDDLVHHLTGVEMQPMKQSIREDDEFSIKKPIMPRPDNDFEELQNWKNARWPKPQFQTIMNSFELLWGGQSKNDQVPGSHIDGVCVLTEINFIKNIKYVIGIDEPYFGKMLYLWMSNGYDGAKITIVDFITFLMPFREDNKPKQHKLCFEILDIDHDRMLNILNLLHLHKYLSPRTLLQKEIILIIDEYLRKNILNNNKRLNRIEIDYENYHKLLTSSCIRNEIRRKFWGINEPFEPHEPDSICRTLEGEQLRAYYTED